MRSQFTVTHADHLKDVPIEKVALVLQTHQCQAVLVACRHVCASPSPCISRGLLHGQSKGKIQILTL